MKTLILPGFSPKNKNWADSVQKQIIQSATLEWAHWQTDKAETNWLENEARKIVGEIKEPTNFIAKSMGTAVAMKVLEWKEDFIHKIILCGIPMYDLQEGDKSLYEPLKKFPAEKIICFQNDLDNHGSYDEVEKFLHILNPKLKIVSKPRDDHEYPYFEDFIDFLNN